MEIVSGAPRCALAVYAHPDDADVACGGTMAAWSAAGCAVHLVVCTDGGRGTHDPSVLPEALAKARAGEVAASAGVVGLATWEILGTADGELGSATGLVEVLVQRIRRIRPDVVLGHDPSAVFFGEDYFNHADHRAAGWALLDAVAPAAALPHYYPHAGPPHQVSVAYLSGTLEPGVWVDITETVDQKVSAVSCHGSQFAVEGNWAESAVRQRAREEGRRAGLAHAEGFRRLRLGG